MLEKIAEGRNISYVVRMNRQIDDFPLFMDATRIIENAIRRDRSVGAGYPAEGGPNYAIERYRIEEYVGYVTDKLTRDNFYKFDTKNYRFFLGSVAVRK